MGVRDAVTFMVARVSRPPDRRPPRCGSLRLRGRRSAPRWRVLVGMLVAAAALPTVRAGDITVYRGMCDASAAVALDDSHLVVASDEDNTLRVYRRGSPWPVASVALAAALGAARESDLEAAARIDDVVYWISSHGRNAKGEVRKDRYRFFATAIDRSTSPPTVKPPTVASADIVGQMLAAGSLRAWRLDEAARLAPEAPGGLNIEGLAATPDGRLLIGFRNPIRDHQALVVPLENPKAYLDGAPARFGAPVGLDLGGRGVRSIERVGTDYVVVAGPTADRGDFAVYRWSGEPGAAPRRLADVALGSLRPEAIFEWPGTGTLQLLSDDGGTVANGVACKDRPRKEQSFRSIELRP